MGQETFGIPQNLVKWLRTASEASILIETGTNQGGTARWASEHFDRVITIEGFRPLYEKVSKDPSAPRNVNFLFGDSRVVLPTVIAELSEPAILWLDAHWCGDQTFGLQAECPILEEISALNAVHQHQQGHVIMVDDARLFLEPPPEPHRAEDWPDIATVCELLTDVPGGRYVFVHRDVVVAVPQFLRNQTVQYLRSVALARQEVQRRKEYPDSFLRRVMRKLVTH